MRLIIGGLTTTLAALELASVTFAATNANALACTVGSGFTISMNKKTVKAGTYVIRSTTSRRSTTSTSPGQASTRRRASPAPVRRSGP
jgi:hypothetical protein